MKHADQNEVDLLLRSLARNSGDSSARSDDALSEHLDADELNAFAEGVLPEGARTRYSAHLADCPSCRGIVINLTQAAGVAVRPPAVTERSPSSLLQQLSALFSQPVLRFVVPAIVLASILGIGLLVLQQDQPGEFIAKHEPSQQTSSLDDTNQAKPADSPSQTAAPSGAAPTPLQSVVTPTADEPKGESGGRAAGAGVSQEPVIARKEADAQPAEATPTFAPDLNAPAAPPPLPAYTARDRAQTLAKEEAAKREDQAERADEVKVQTSEGVDDRRKLGAAAKAGTRPAQPANVQGLMRERGEDEDKNKKDSTGRTDSRTVSGKRFVRKNNQWVDSAYDSSRGTTNVKRGSEQYRALVADEPGIRPFAEQLSGEVIVVWKGRAYRFY